MSIVLRAASTTDVDAIEAIATKTGLFAPEDMGPFSEMLNACLAGEMDEHHWVVALDGTSGDASVVGAAYFAPEGFSDRVWNLYFLGVAPDGQRSGVGATLVRHVEETLSNWGTDKARVLIVETSGVDAFAPIRAFYSKLGFVEEARIRDYYGPGDAKVVFWKLLDVDDVNETSV